MYGGAGALPDLFVFCVAAVILRERCRLMAECHSQDDALRLFNSARPHARAPCASGCRGLVL